MNQTGFLPTISTENKGEWTDRNPLGFSEGFEIPEAEAGQRGSSSWFVNSDVLKPGQSNGIGMLDSFSGEF